jgi:diadenosine tetraphosphate (Ap4A) HIT family hydrolase
MTSSNTVCELCRQPGGEELYRDERLRVVLVEDAQYPGFCRVIWNEHVKEMTDLAEADRSHLMQAVWQAEAAVRDVMRPDKMNVASLGNMVPHLHWHVIPRYSDDAHFPSPIWAQVHRAADEKTLASRKSLLPLLCEAVKQRFTHAV